MYEEESVKQGGSSQSGDIFLLALLLLTVFYLKNRFLYLAIFSFVVWLGWAFTLWVCVWLTRKRKWSGQPYAWAIAGLVIGCFTLGLGGAFAQYPPKTGSYFR
jgi:predicted MFS family arabinose efflux permease